MFRNTKAFGGFSVNDIAAAREFYGQTLGLDVTEANGMLTLHLAGENKIIVYPKPNHIAATFTILNFPVPAGQLEKVVKEMQSQGVKFEVYTDGPLQTDDSGIFRKGGPLIAWFKDPAGNFLSVLEQ
jgi:catechol 2,3-dioxygenase-like lactoylglutathione lyase family enzyme